MTPPVTTEAVERLKTRAGEIETHAAKHPIWNLTEAVQHAADLRLLCARLEELEGALREIADQAANQDLSHVNFRVGAEAIAHSLLPQQQEGKR